MPFLAKTDYRFSINLTVLDSLTGGDDSIVDELSLEAIEEMKSCINERYNVISIFSAVGTDRNRTIMMYCKDIALYHIYSIYSLTPIPQSRINRYAKALSWLQDVRDQKINVDGLTLSTNPDSAMVKSGGNDKRGNYQQ